MNETAHNEVFDLELTVRIGSLDAETSVAIANHALGATRSRGLGDLDALDLARGLHWLAVGHREDCTSSDMIAALALRPLAVAECHRLGSLLEVACRLGEPRQRSLHPPDPLGLTDRRMLGWRIALALALLVDHELDLAMLASRSPL